MGNGYEARWKDTQRKRQEAHAGRAEALEGRRREDAMIAAERHAVIAQGFTAADVDRWGHENRVLIERRLAEDRAWGAQLARWADEDRRRQEAWAAANPEAARLLEAMPS